MADERILVVDDEVDLATSCQRMLVSKGYDVTIAGNGEEALARIQEEVPHLVLTDLKMPGMDGMELLQHLKADYPQQIQAVMMTAFSTVEDAVVAMRLGAADFVPKPFSPDHLLIVVEKALADRSLREENRNLKEQLGRHYSFDNIIGRSPSMSAVFEAVKKVADTNISVLVGGASGTGKELIARAIHFGSARRDGPFVPVNCAAIPGELVESLLLGHVRGAFTGADEDRAGYFETAHRGTLFLDEIGDMPQELQSKLLRVLEDGEVWRVGAGKGKAVDVRVLAATNAQLQERIEAGTFRQDLYFRLARFTVLAPPLRERREDIPLLARHFLQLFAGEMGREAPELDAEVLELLQDYAFPGNVRELKNVIERALIESGGGPIQPYHLHFAPAAASATSASTSSSAMPDLPLDLSKAADQAELWVAQRALDMCDGNISEAARLLGTNRNKIYRVLEQGKESG